MQPAQPWQHGTDPRLQHAAEPPRYRPEDGSVVDAAGHRLEQAYQAPQPGGLDSAGGADQINATHPAESVRLPTSAPLSYHPYHNQQAGPSSYSGYHQSQHGASAFSSPYEARPSDAKSSFSGSANFAPPHLPGTMTQPPISMLDPRRSQMPSHPSAGRSRHRHHPQSTTTRVYPNGTVGPSLKRGMACGFCRKRKLRCNAERPACSNCLKFKKECEYQPPPKDSDDEDEGEMDPLTTPSYGPSHMSGYRTASSSSLSESFVSPAGPHHFDFPPPLGYDIMPQRAVQPMGPPGFGTSPDGVVPRQYGSSGYGYPFNSLPIPSDQPVMGTPLIQASSAPAHTSVFNHPSDPTQHQFTQYGTLSFPPWTNIQDSPSYPMMTTTSLPGQPAAPISAVELPEQLDIKPFIQEEPAHIYPRREPEQNLSHVDPPRFTPPTQLRPSHTLSSVDSARSLRSIRSSPDPGEAPPPSMFVDPNSPYTYDEPPPKHSALFSALTVPPMAVVDPMDGLTARLGEFLFTPMEPPKARAKEQEKVQGQDGPARKRKQSISRDRREAEGAGTALVQQRLEPDGLTDSAREQLLNVFLTHSRLFFEMSVPRFRQRLTFTDRRRPALSLLNAMYLWASRMTAAPKKSPMEETFFQAGCRSLESQTSRPDRLIDGMRAGMLLSAYAYTNGRYHEGFILAGVAARLVTSTGVHQIPSCTLGPPPIRNPLLRQMTFLLPPPEDKLELAERIHTFWAVYSIERCGALVTGFPSALRDEDIMTPFPRPLVDIASGNVTSKDDTTVRDLYRFSSLEVEDDSRYVKWTKAMTILERATKLAYIDPTEESEYAKAWFAYHTAHPSVSVQEPLAMLDQPKYRCPRDYRLVKLGLDQFVHSMGVEGIFPVDRKRNAQIDGAAEPFIPSHNLAIHHTLAATQMFLHDINSIECENADALAAARRSVALIKNDLIIPVSDVESFVVVIWGMVARTLLKEMHRLRLRGDHAGAALVEAEVDVMLGEMQRVGESMAESRSQALGLEALKAMDSRSFTRDQN